MVDFIRGTYQGLARACLVALFFVLAGVSAANAASGYFDKINICDYGSQDFSRLEAELRGKILGKRLRKYFFALDTELNVGLKKNPPNVASFFQNVPDKIPTFGNYDKAVQTMTNVPPGGTRQSVEFHCPISHGNVNYWGVDVLTNEAGKATVLTLYLWYEDKDFSARDIAPTPYRFIGDADFSDAVDKWGHKNALSRDAFRAEFLSAGFLFNNSCESDGILSDVYVEPPYPPDSVYALMGGYLSLDSPANIVAVFSGDNGKFLRAAPEGKFGSYDCKISKDIYWQQIENWLKSNYPENALVKRIMKAGGIERARVGKAKREKAENAKSVNK